MATLVDIKNLAIAYGKAPPVLAGFTAALERGSFTAVVGPSGVGKSTLLRVLSGLTTPAAGTVDMPMQPEKGRRPVALVFQEARLLPWRRVLENVSFGLEGTGLSKAERKARAQGGVLDDVPVGLPALTRAAKLTKRAGRVGFDWPSTDEVFDKLAEEVEELRVEIAAGDKDKAREELGDLLFVVANLARKLDVEPEDALRGANAKFVRRFGFIEAELARDGRTPDQSTLEEMDRLWDAAKAAEKPPS